MNPADALLLKLTRDRVYAHEFLFKHRHPDKTPDFHRTLIAEFHSPHPRLVIEVFRDGGKSTIAEETSILCSTFGEIRNGLIVGASYERAVERLASIKHELENNEDIIELFGEQRSEPWTESIIVLKNGVSLQAKGVGQSLRGIKRLDARPDFCIIDDLEDEESVRTPEARNQKLRWLYKTLMPALHRNARIRFLGNRLDPSAVIVKIANDASWRHLRFPIEYEDVASGERKAAWPAKFPLPWVDAKREEMTRQGLLEDFMQEYMCEAEADSQKLFTARHFENVVRPRVRTWEATYAMLDPGRSTGKRAATSALPIWSWINNRLVVWECPLGIWLPDEIVRRIFIADEKYRPVFIGVEEDTLNQFLMQPLRHAQIKYGQLLPLEPIQARAYTEGRGKLDFIRSLQPFFANGEVEFAQEMPELVAQFLSYPKGAIDGPNALAYAPKLRPGLPFYDDFSRENVADDAAAQRSRRLYFAMNATRRYVAGALVQFDGAILRILGDWVEEGDPGQVATQLVRRAALEAGMPFTVTGGPDHFQQWSNVGLRAALARIPMELTMAGEPIAGRDELRRLLKEHVRGFPALQISPSARWTLNGFAGGYARGLRKKGQIEEEARDGPYKVLMEGIESYAGLLKIEVDNADREGVNYQFTDDGRRYMSARKTS